MNAISVCTADEAGPGCGAELPRAGTNLEHCDHDRAARSRVAVLPGLRLVGRRSLQRMHVPGCEAVVMSATEKKAEPAYVHPAAELFDEVAKVEADSRRSAPAPATASARLQGGRP